MTVRVLFYLAAGRHMTCLVGNKRQHSPPLVKLFENGMSKWTGAIFGILDVLLSLPGDKTFTKHTGRQHKCVSERCYFIQY